MKPSPQPSERQIRVFISSTFRDMQAERDILIKKIFPQLRKLCEERAVTWTEVDLRWGITDEEVAEGKVLPFCLEEIQRCRPYFIGLLGDRYGSLPREIPAELLERQNWLEQYHDKSITELEIIHGALRDKEMHGHAYFYFRDPKYLEQVPKEKRSDFTAEDARSAEKLEQLKKEIRRARDEQVCQLRENFPDSLSLGEWILEDFTALIERLYPREQVPDLLDQEDARQEAYARSRRLAFVGREDLLSRLGDHCAMPGKPLVLTGESGCGKSALLAEWIARWRKGHPGDLIIQHYIGSTPDSADWQGLVRRILGELKRAFAITDEIPVQPDALRGALHGWTVKAAGSRRVVLVLDALNQITEDGAARQLGWLPIVFPANFLVFVSSLPGESHDVLRRRGWSELRLPLFARADIAPAVLAYFKIFSKTPPPDTVVNLESTPAACNALYLRVVLDELRQFGKHEELKAKTSDYLSAPDLPGLFDRILTRWHDDFGSDPQYPDLVRRSLCFIACARVGLTEAELLDLLGKNGGPLPRRVWTPFYLAAENALALRAGLLNLGHDYLRAAVQKRWLEAAGTMHQFRLQLAEHFSQIEETTHRKLDELPWLLRQAEEWDKLCDMLKCIPTFLQMNVSGWKWELHGYWAALQQHRDPVATYQESLRQWEDGPSGDPAMLPLVLNELEWFHENRGEFERAESLARRALTVCETILGAEDPSTLVSVNNLAVLLSKKGAYTEAETFCRRALKANVRVLGAEHPTAICSMHNLAVLLTKAGDYTKAEPLSRRALAAHERVFGAEHPATLRNVNELAALIRRKGEYSAAEPLYRRAFEARTRVLGAEDPETLESAEGLNGLLVDTGNYEAAQSLHYRTLAVYERLLGPEHPTTLGSLNGLGLLLTKRGDYVAAEPLYRRALEASNRVLGAEHPSTLDITNGLALVLKSKGDYSAAEPLYRRVLNARERLWGYEHPETLTSMNNLAVLLMNKGDYSSAEPLCRRVFETRKRVLGVDHPTTLVSANNLALLLASKGDFVSAEPLDRLTLEARERVLGVEHPETLTSVNNLALVLQRKGDHASAEVLFIRALEARERVLGVDHPDTLGTVSNLATLQASKGDFAAAEPLYRRALEGALRLSKANRRSHPNLQTFLDNYATLLRIMGRNEGEVLTQLKAVGRPFGIQFGG